MDLHFHGVWRMDWGFANPNKTAVLVVTLLFTVWAFAFLWRKGFWLSLILSSGLGVLLVHTFSRGGVVAFGAGVLTLIYFAPRPWPKARVIGVVVCVWMIAGATVYLQANQRFAQGMQDRSIANRVEIWAQVPKMIADAPMGWGVGNAVRTYQNWYQPLDHGVTYLNLVSSHFTWLVEFSWWERILYCFGWAAVGILCWPPRGRESFKWFIVPLAIWIAFFVTATFSHVAEELSLWVLPGIALLVVLAVRWRFKVWPLTMAWAGSMSVSTLLVVAVTIWGMRAPGLHVHGSRNLVKIGDGEPPIWIVVNTDIMGDHYGKALRGYMNDHSSSNSVRIIYSLRDLPADHQGLVVVAGQLPEADLKLLHEEDHLLLFCPTFYPQEAKVTRAQLAGVFFGEFSQSPSIQAWQSVGQVKTLEGVGDFVASWPELVYKTAMVSHDQGTGLRTARTN